MTADAAIELARNVDRSRGHYRMAEAEKLAGEALESFPDSVDVLIAWGRVLLSTHRPAEALAVFSQAEGQAPGDDRPVGWRIAAISRLYAFDEAIAAGNAALERLPGSVRIRVAVGRVYLDSSCPQDALPFLADAVGISPADETAISWHAACLAALRGWAQAERVMREAITQHGGSAELHYRLGRILLDDHRHNEALECFQAALVHDPEHAGALEWQITALRDRCLFTEAESRAAEAVEYLPQSALLHTERAWVACDQGKYDEALARVQQALHIEPASSWALCSLIGILRQAHRYRDAEQAAVRAMQACEDDSGVFVAAAWVACDQGKYDEALARVQQALHIEPASSWALCSRIDFLREAHRFEEAGQAVATARSVRPDDPDILVAAAWVSSDQDYEVDAVARADEALKIDPCHPAALTGKIYFLRWARLFTEAEQAAEEARLARPGDADVLAAAGWVCSDLDGHQKALEYIDQALDIDRCSSWILNCRINFLRAAGRYDEAEQFARQVQQDRPDDPDLQVAAGWLYGDRDLYPAALAAFDRALDANPWHLDALVWRVAALRSLLRFSDAQKTATHATKCRPCDLAVHTELGRVYDTRLAFDAALTCFSKILAREPENIDALIAKSAALRSLRNYEEAESEIARAFQVKRGNRDLQMELGWIRYDQGLPEEARQIFQELHKTAVNRREKAATHYGLGWASFAARDFISAAEQFRAADGAWPGDSNYRLGLAWSLARQDRVEHWSEAEDIAHEIAGRRPDPFAHACLGVIAFKRGSLALAEYHLKKALELDPYHASYTDLGALYAHTARYAEAEEELRKAVKRDWYDKAAHQELGCLFLQLGGSFLPDAQHQFRQALAINPASARAAIGLAWTLVKSGDETQAESVLRGSLRRQDKGKRWQTHLALAKLLARQGDKQQNQDLYAEAYQHAQQAIRLAPDAEAADPYFIAGLAQFRVASLTPEPVRRGIYQRRAKQYLSKCTEADECYPEAQRYLQALEHQTRLTLPALWGGIALGTVSLILLTAMWIMYFMTTKVSENVLLVNTPVLAGLLAISALLPALIRLKLPGFEADLQPHPAHEAPGPTGDDTFGPGRFTVTAGPTGQIPRRGQSRHQFAKNSNRR